jgi:endonuclease YncB( thermonuclease family)
MKLQRLMKWFPLGVSVLLVLAAVQPWNPDRVNDIAASVAPAVGAANSEVWQLVPGSIYDGDTLTVQRNGIEMKVRLCGIDAPEQEQPMGIAARDHLRSLIDKGDGSIVVVPVEKDRYGRMVVELFVKPRIGLGYQAGEEIAVNAQMVADGYAYQYVQYSGGCPNGQVLSGLEATAQQQRLGVWRDGEAERPWEYRKRH